MRATLLISVLFFSIITNAQTKVLFLGNSFTYTFDVPALFTGLSGSAGISVIIDQNTQAGMAVADEQIVGHVNDAVSQSKITSQQWDYVVVQDNMGNYVNNVGVISSACGNANVALYNMIKANNPCTRIIYFAGWGPLGGVSGGDNTTACIDRIHGNMIFLNNGIGQEIVTPIGKAWNTSIIQLPAVNLFYTDNVHPSLEGSYLAAATIFTSIFKIDPTNLSYTGSVNPTTAQIMRTIAYNTVTNSTYLTTTNLSAFSPVISQSGAVLSVPAGYSSYQWFLNGNAIGANTNSFTITANGDYYVEVTNSSGCLMSSFNVIIFSTGIVNADVLSDGLKISPISTNLFELSSSSMGKISIFDMQGKHINTFEKRNERIKLDLSNSTAGVYLLIFSDGQSRFSKKIIVF